MKIFLYVLFFSMLLELGLSQEYKYKNITVRDGLSFSTVTSINQDQFGRIWLATVGGLNYYNGDQIDVLTTGQGLLDNNVKGIEFDSRDNLWIASVKGVSKYDGSVFKHFPVKYYDSDFDNWITNVFVQKNDDVWFVPLGGGLGKIDGDSTIFYNNKQGFTDAIVTGIVEVSQNQIIISTINGDLYKYKDGEFTLWKSFLKPIYYLYKDSSNTLWVTLSEELIKLGSKDEITPVSGYNIHSIIEQDSNLWLGTNKGLLSFDKSTGDFKVFESKSIPEGTILDLFIDRENQLWYATQANGVGVISESKFKKMDRSTGLSGNVVTSILQDKEGMFWLGYFDTQGVDRINGEEILNIRFGDFFESNKVIVLNEDHYGNIWVGTRNGLFKLDKSYSKERFTIEDGLPSNRIIDIKNKKDGSILVATINGFAEFSSGTFKTIYYGEYIKSLFELSEDSLLVGTIDGLRLMVNNEFQNISSFDELDGIEVMAINQDNHGCIWLGTFNHGLIHFDKTWNMTTYNAETGLASDIIFSIAFDSDSTMMLGTSRGVNRVLFEEIHKLSGIEYFGKGDGFSSVETNEDAIIVDHENKTWIGTVDGVFIFNSQAKSEEFIPEVYLTSVSDIYGKVNIQDYSKAVSSWFGIPVGLNLPHTSEGLSISFDAISLWEKEKIQYKYRLLGLNETWSNPESAGSAQILNLGAGNYTFQVVAGDGLNWSNTPTEFSFTVLRPFWDALWFRLLTLILFICIVYLIIRWKVNFDLKKQLKLDIIKEQQYRELKDEMARDFHDELGNKLAGIIAYSSILEMSESNNLDIVKKIKTTSQDVFTGTKDFMWSLSSVSESALEMLFYLRDFGEELFSESDTHFVFNELEENVINTTNLPSAVNRQIILIFKEAFTNCFKHADANKAWLNASISDELIIKFEDNGKGFIIEESPTNGLKNMWDRADKVGAELEVNSSSSGTEVILKININ